MRADCTASSTTSFSPSSSTLSTSTSLRGIASLNEKQNQSPSSDRTHLVLDFVFSLLGRDAFSVTNSDSMDSVTTDSSGSLSMGVMREMTLDSFSFLDTLAATNSLPDAQVSSLLKVFQVLVVRCDLI